MLLLMAAVFKFLQRSLNGRHGRSPLGRVFRKEILLSSRPYLLVVVGSDSDTDRILVDTIVDHGSVRVYPSKGRECRIVFLPSSVSVSGL